MASDPGSSRPPQTPAEGVALVYVNWFRTEGSPGDLAVDVGYQSGNTPPQPAARLAMTWEHAKLLRDTLTKVLEEIEPVIGEPRDLLPHMRLGPPQFGPGAVAPREGGGE
jgi:hypothetical protein